MAPNDPPRPPTPNAAQGADSSDALKAGRDRLVGPEGAVEAQRFARGQVGRALVNGADRGTPQQGEDAGPADQAGGDPGGGDPHPNDDGGTSHSESVPPSMEWRFLASIAEEPGTGIELIFADWLEDTDPTDPRILYIRASQPGAGLELTQQDWVELARRAGEKWQAESGVPAAYFQRYAPLYRYGVPSEIRFYRSLPPPHGDGQDALERYSAPILEAFPSINRLYFYGELSRWRELLEAVRSTYKPHTLAVTTANVPAAELDNLLATPSLESLQELSLPLDAPHTVECVARSPRLINLHSLKLTQTTDRGNALLQVARNIQPLRNASFQTSLRELRLPGCHIGGRGIDVLFGDHPAFPNLRRVSINDRRLARNNGMTIRRSVLLPALEELDLSGCRDMGDFGVLSGIASILFQDHCRSMRILNLSGLRLGDPTVNELLQSPNLWKTLERLDLSGTGLTEKHVRALAESPLTEKATVSIIGIRLPDAYKRELLTLRPRFEFSGKNALLVEHIVSQGRSGEEEL